MRVSQPATISPPAAAHVLALDPLWGPPDPPWWPYPGYADELAASRVFEPAAGLAAAAAAFFPEDWKHARQDADGTARAEAFVAAAREAGVPAVFFWASDATDAFPFPDAYVCRPSLFRSRRRPRELAMPAFTRTCSRTSANCRFFGSGARRRPSVSAATR